MQALHSLYSQGNHDDYHGKYISLNDKKYLPLQFLAIRDRHSVKELYQYWGENITDEEADRRYELYGGAAGDLQQCQKLDASAMEKWDDVACAVLWRLVGEQ